MTGNVPRAPIVQNDRSKLHPIRYFFPHEKGHKNKNKKIESKNSKNMVSKIALLVWTLRFPSMIAALPPGICNINGQVFLAGESLGENFVTRCGSADDFPCFCNPDLEQQIECPYCGFATLSGELLCAGDNEVVGFVDLTGNEKVCGCSAPSGGTPAPNCDAQIKDSANGDTCTFDLPDGISKVFASGEPLDFLGEKNRCGSDFPCFCNPSKPGSIECPYCRFPSSGGDLVCARDRENVNFIDLEGVDQTCSCQVDSVSGEVMSACNPTDELFPSSPTPVPQIDEFCSLELESGQIITFAVGESYGDYLTNRCGSSEEFPCFCNPAMHNQIECPYCGFASGDGSLYCAKDQETISYQYGGATQTCSCEIPDDPFQEPIRSCSDNGAVPTSAPIVPPPSTDEEFCTLTKPNGDVVFIKDGESFGDLFERGVCGSTQEWPTICNPSIEDTISRQINQAEYPYCVFENTASGETVCARHSETVSFEDDAGVKQTCTCAYLGAALGGAQGTCRPTIDETATPAPSEPTSSAQQATAMGLLSAVVMALFVVQF